MSSSSSSVSRATEPSQSKYWNEADHALTRSDAAPGWEGLAWVGRDKLWMRVSTTSNSGSVECAAMCAWNDKREA